MMSTLSLELDVHSLVPHIYLASIMLLNSLEMAFTYERNVDVDMGYKPCGYLLMHVFLRLYGLNTTILITLAIFRFIMKMNDELNCIAKTLRTSALFETTAIMMEMAVLFDAKSPAFIWIWLLFTAHYYFSFLRNFYRAYHKKFSVKNFVDEESLGAVYFALANLVAFDVLIFFHMELFFPLILVSHFFAMHYMQWQAYKGIKMGSTEENETKAMSK